MNIIFDYWVYQTSQTYNSMTLCYLFHSYLSLNSHPIIQLNTPLIALKRKSILYFTYPIPLIKSSPLGMPGQLPSVEDENPENGPNAVLCQVKMAVPGIWGCH